MTTPHNHKVKKDGGVFGHGTGKYQAECDCGWTSRPTFNFACAEEDWKDHRAEMQRLEKAS